MARAAALGRTFLSIAACAVLGAGTLLATPRPVVANHSESTGFASGAVGCQRWLANPACIEWEHVSPEGEHVWRTVDEKAAPGASLRARHDFGFRETYGLDGGLRSVTISGTLTTSNTGGGTAHVDADYDVDIESPGASISVSGSVTSQNHGSDYILGNTQFRMSVECENDKFEYELETGAGGSEPTTASKAGSPSAQVDAAGGSCHIELDAGALSGTNQPAPGESGSTDLTFEITFATGEGPGCNGLQGVVTDGPLGVHDNALGGIRVQVWRDGQPTGTAVATDAEGRFCLPSSDGANAGSLKLRATLIDQRRSPPLFATHYHGSSVPSYVEVGIQQSDFGSGNLTSVAFSDPAMPYLSDLANIHWQATRFVDWLTDTLGWSAATIGPFTIQAFDDGGTRYLDKTVYIKAAGSPFTRRDEPYDNGPENAEWHEIVHHFEWALGIGSSTGTVCAGQVNHGGWTNAGTCDSLNEGFAMWLPTLASRDLDQGRGTGYATSFYANIAGLETQDFRPWSVALGSEGSVRQDEDLAVSVLLWDLVDDTPQEQGTINVTEGGLTVQVSDRISIPANELVNLLALAGAKTVTDVRDAVAASTLLPGSATARTIHLDADGSADISQLDALFLMHGFHPVRDLAAPAYQLGDEVSRTDHVPLTPQLLQPRSDIEEVPGSYIRLANGTPGPLTFTIDVTDPAEPRHQEVAVAANSTELVYLELPPYYPQAIEPGAGLPACGGPEVTPRTLTISVPTIEPKVLDSCAYLHAVVATTDGAAVTVSVGSGPFGAGASPGQAAPSAAPAAGGPAAEQGLSPIVLIMIGAAAIVLIGVGLVLGLRRRRAPTGPAP